jgi:hypothetical protein
MPDLVVYASDVTDLGRGFTTIDGNSMGLGLVPVTVGPPLGGDGVQISYTYSLVQSIEDLASAMDMNASLSMRFGLFGSSAKFSFASSTKVHDESLFVCLDIRVQRAAQQLKAPITYDQVALDLRVKNPMAFREAYGDAYVAATRSGGELSVVIEIHTHSSTEREDIAVALKGNYGVKIDFDGSFKKAFEQQASNRQVTAQYHQVGGPPIDVHNGAQIDPLKLLDEAQRWLETISGTDPAAARAHVFQATLLPWATAPVIGGPTPVGLAAGAELLDRLSIAQTKCIDRLALLGYVLEHPDEYDAAGSTPLDQIDAQRSAVEARLEAIIATARAVAKDVQHPPTVADLDAAFGPLPPRPVLVRSAVALKVPNVLGLSESEALTVLQAANLVIAKDGDTWDEEQTPGRVASTNPGRDVQVEPGSTVHYSLYTNDPDQKPPEWLPWTGMPSLKELVAAHE